MLNIIRPQASTSPAALHDAYANLNLCFTCGTCLTACPVNRATSRLAPVKLVRLAAYGLWDDLVQSQNIWYCLNCSSCLHECPMTVKPVNLIQSLRREAIRRQVVHPEDLARYDDLCTRFHRVRWHAALRCRTERELSLSKAEWRRMLDTPVEESSGPVSLKRRSSNGLSMESAIRQSGISGCFTCGECRGVCPVFKERGVFDPLGMSRLINMGLTEDVLQSPSIWLCLSCQKCLDHCSQKVSGHIMFRRLQEVAVAKGFVDESFPQRWRETDKALFSILLDEIDDLFGLSLL